TRWRRTPARGTSWRLRTWPGSPSRTRTPPGRRAGLLCKPGRGFFQDLLLFAKHAVLATKTVQFLALISREPVVATPVIQLRLLHPIPDAILGRLELSRQLGDASPRSSHLHDPPPVLR